MPAAAVAPSRPARPRLVTSDTTIEAVADILVATPRGLLLHRDELAAFIGAFDRYGSGKGGSDRPAWLESWNAKPKTIDRKSRPDPVFVPKFGVSIIGTIQPDRLEEMTAGADDGLIARFLFAFPEPRAFARPTRSHDPEPWKADLARLLRLPMVPVEGGDLRPWYMHFSDAAANVIESAAGEWAGREANASGLMLGALGKARGQAVRLALILELLRWCAERPNQDAPSTIGEDAAMAAVGLLDGYFLDMAMRAFGQGVLTNAERHARTLLRHIVASGAGEVNERAIRETPNLPGLSSADAVQAAVGVLKRDDVLLEARRPEGRGRPRTDHIVNPRLWELVSRPREDRP